MNPITAAMEAALRIMWKIQQIRIMMNFVSNVTDEVDIRS